MDNFIATHAGIAAAAALAMPATVPVEPVIAACLAVVVLISASGAIWAFRSELL